MAYLIEASENNFPILGVPLNPGTFRIGRAPNCEIRLNSPAVENVHATIEFDGQWITFHQLARKKPVLVNERSARSTVLDLSDTLSLDPFTIRFVEEGKKSQLDANALRLKLHRELVNRLDLGKIKIEDLDDKELRSRCEKLIDEIFQTSYLPGDVDRARLKLEVLNEALGLGPLEDLLSDTNVSEIMVNNKAEIFVEQKGRLTKAPLTFTSDEQVINIIGRIVGPIGRRIDESSPMVDARLKDGSRVNAIIPPLALRGPSITIRKFPANRLTTDDMIGFRSMTQPMAEFLEFAVKGRRNIVISGGTGSGKTTLLNVLSNFIPQDERVVTIEDSAELKLFQPNLVSLESRPPNVEGKGAIPIRELVKNALRMRPDRIIVGECRSGETLDMLQAMNTGHDGSLTTLHANSPDDATLRIETMVMMAGYDLPIRVIRMQIASAIHLVVQQNRLTDGTRKITAISEVTGLEDDNILFKDVFRFERTGFDKDGNILGYHTATGHVPKFVEDFRRMGIPLDDNLFKPTQPPESATTPHAS